MTQPTVPAPAVVLIAGGGTGGHLYPGIAVAEAITASDPKAGVAFVGTRRGIEARVLPKTQFPVHFIEVSGLKQGGLLGKLRGLFRLPKALWQSRKLIKRLRPDVVIGVGGYASGPVVLVARLMRKKTAVLEQNTIPGLANRILGKIVHKIFTTFEMSHRYFPKKKIVHAGNPVRFFSTPKPTGDGAPATDASGPPRLLITGGSQGAHALNLLLPEALALVKARGVAFALTHQTGEADQALVREAYAKHGIEADVRAFIEGMHKTLAQTDFVVARAGATTLSELAVFGVPAFLVPYPHATDNHQEHNGRAFVEAGAAWMTRQSELTAEALAEKLTLALGDQAVRRQMAEAAKTLAKPNAASTVAAWCLSHQKNRG